MLTPKHISSKEDEIKFYFNLLKTQEMYLSDKYAHIHALMHYVSDEPGLPLKDLISVFGYDAPIDGNMKQQLKVIYDWYGENF